MAQRRHLALFFYGATPSTRYNEILYNDPGVDSTWRRAITGPYSARFSSTPGTSANHEAQRASWRNNILSWVTGAGTVANYEWSGSSLNVRPTDSQTLATSVDWHPQMPWLATGRNSTTDELDIKYYNGSTFVDHELTDDIYSAPGEITYPDTNVNAVRWMPNRESSATSTLSGPTAWLFVSDDNGKLYRYTLTANARDSGQGDAEAVLSGPTTLAVGTSGNSVTEIAFDQWTGTNASESRMSVIIGGDTLKIINASSFTVIQTVNNIRSAEWRCFPGSNDYELVVCTTAGNLEVWTESGGTFSKAADIDAVYSDYRYARWDPTGSELYAVQDTAPYVRVFTRTDTTTWSGTDLTIAGETIPLQPTELVFRPQTISVVASPVVADDYVESGYVSDGSLQSAFTVFAQLDQTVFGSADLSVAATVTAEAGRILEAQASIDSALTATVTVDLDLAGIAQVEAVFTVATTADVIRGASADIAAEATVYARPSDLHEALADLSAEFTTTGQLSQLLLAEAGLTSTALTTALGGLIIEPTDLWVYDWDSLATWDTWYWNRWELRGAHDFSQATVTGQLELLRLAEAALAAEATVTAVAGYEISAEATVAAEFTCEPSILLIRGGASLVASAGDLTATATVTYDGQADLTAEATAAGTLSGLILAQADLAVEAATTAQAQAVFDAVADLNSEFTAAGLLGQQVTGAASMSAEFAVETAINLLVQDRYRFARVRRETRTIRVEQATRTIRVQPETRTWLVEGYEVN